MGVVECRSTLCIQLFKQGPSMRGCSRYGGSRGCWGGPRAPPSLDPPTPVDVLPLAVPLELLYDRQRRPALEGGEDRNTDADRSRVFLYVTSTPSESRRPSSLSGIRNGPGTDTAQLGPVLSEKLPTWVRWDPPRQLACLGETSMGTAEIRAYSRSADCKLKLSWQKGLGPEPAAHQWAA